MPLHRRSTQQSNPQSNSPSTSSANPSSKSKKKTKQTWENPSDVHRQKPVFIYIPSAHFFFPTLSTGLSFLLILASIVFLNYTTGLLPGVVPASAPLDSFSEERAMQHLDYTSNIIGPHHYGTKENEYVAGYLEAKILHYITKSSPNPLDRFLDPQVPSYDSIDSFASSNMENNVITPTTTPKQAKDYRRDTSRAKTLGKGVHITPSHTYFKTTVSNKITKQDIIFEYSREPSSGHYFLDGFIDPRFSLTNSYSNLSNIVLRISPTSLEFSENQPAILLNSHFDTVASSPGASDDGIGFVTMLESARAIVESVETSQSELKYPIIFLFNSAEETLMHGSHAFIANHRWAQNVAVVYNLESAGTWGPEVLFQFRDPAVIYHYAKHAIHPHGTILAQDVFSSGLIPSDTDFRVFVDSGHLTAGLDLALYMNGYLYHTDLDIPKYILPGTAQHFGNNILSMVVHNAYSTQDWLVKALATRKEKIKESLLAESKDIPTAKESTGAPRFVTYSEKMRKKLLDSIVYFDFLGMKMFVFSVWPFIAALMFSIIVGSLFFKWDIFLILLASFFMSLFVPIVVSAVFQYFVPYHWYSSWVLALSFYSGISCFSGIMLYSVLMQRHFDSLCRNSKFIVSTSEENATSNVPKPDGKGSFIKAPDPVSFYMLSTNIKGTLIFSFSLTALVLLSFGFPTFGLITMIPFCYSLELVITYALDHWWSHIPQCFDFHDFENQISPSNTYFAYLWFRRILNYLFRAFPLLFWISVTFATTSCIVSIAGRMGPVPGEIVVAVLASLFSSVTIYPWILTILPFGQSRSSWEESGRTPADAQEKKRANPSFLIFMRRNLFLFSFSIACFLLTIYLLFQPAYRPLAPKRLMLQTSTRYPTEYLKSDGASISVSETLPTLSFIMSRLDCNPISDKVVNLFHDHSQKFGQGISHYHYPADPMNPKNISLENALDYFDSWSWEVFYPVNFLFEGYNFLSTEAVGLIDPHFQENPFRLSVESSLIVDDPFLPSSSSPQLWRITLIASKKHMEWITLRVGAENLVYWSVVDGDVNTPEIPDQHPLDFHYVRFISGVHFDGKSTDPIDEPWRISLWIKPNQDLILHFNGCDQDSKMMDDFIDSLPMDHSAIYVNSVSLTTVIKRLV